MASLQKITSLEKNHDLSIQLVSGMTDIHKAPVLGSPKWEKHVSMSLFVNVNVPSETQFNVGGTALEPCLKSSGLGSYAACEAGEPPWLTCGKPTVRHSSRWKITSSLIKSTKSTFLPQKITVLNQQNYRFHGAF